MESIIYKYPVELLCTTWIFCFIIVVSTVIWVRLRMRQRMVLLKYEESYRMLSDTFCQAGIEYDFLNDRLILFGEKRDAIDIPDVVEGLHEKMKKRAIRITLTAEEFDKICMETEPGKAYQTEFQCGMTENGWNWFSMIYVVAYTEEAHPKPIRLIGYLVDAEKQHQTQEKLVEIGQYDMLTGVFNRAGAEEQMIEALQNLEEYSQNVFLMMDVDRFKGINDNYGHLCGDDALRVIGQNILEIFQGDTIICRWGGDEFVMFVRGPGAEMGILKKRIEELRSRMKKYKYEEQSCPIGLSIGGIIPKSGMTLQELMKKADGVLYQVKANGRDDYKIKDAYEE